MRFSIRDAKSRLPNLKAQRGQGVVEYILVLVVVVAIILGGIYQLNTAFREWAVNYFGTYLACLLEAGELPSIGGTPGDSGVCNELFKPFNLAEGRRLAGAAGSSTSGSDPKQSGRGAREGNSGGANSRGFSKIGGNGSGNFNGGRGATSGKFGGNKKNKAGSNGAYTGSTETGNYGGSYSATNRRLDTSVKHRLDNKFAFQDDREEDQKKSRAAPSKKEREESRTPAARSKVKQRKEMDKVARADADVGMDFPNFMRYLIIAGIIIALVLVVGGQMLQVGKSME